MTKKTIYIKNIYNQIKRFFKRLNDDHISAFSAQSSFFIILSFLPFLMLLLNLIRYTPITEEYLLEALLAIVPSSFQGTTEKIISEIYTHSDIAIISITAIAAIWASSKGILSLMRGLNCIYDIKEERNYFVLRLYASLYTIALIIGIIASLSILVFGNSLLNFIDLQFPLIYGIVSFIFSFRGIYIPIILAFIFILLYKLIPNKNFNLIDHMPGALFAALGWEIFSYAYSIYIDYFANSSYLYGSLTSIILMLLWIYICMYILFIGAEINVHFHKYFQVAKDKLQS